MTAFEFPDFYLSQKRRVDDALTSWLPDGSGATPELLARAMRYTVLGGGKRLRGVLVLEAGRLGKREPSKALEGLAAVIELIHAYSLIHDDLPAMDDDDFRRGQPSNHREFGEDIAILAGDGLLNRAFEIIGELPELGLSNEDTLSILRTLAAASGSQGLIGGQVRDLRFDPDRASPEDLRRVHRMKTGALMRSALVIGAIAGEVEKPQLESIARLGEGLGLTFQVKDDLLEREGDLEQLGKDPNSDADSGKKTFPDLLGIDGTRQFLTDLKEDLHRDLASLESDTNRLATIIDLVVDRDH